MEGVNICLRIHPNRLLCFKDILQNKINAHLMRDSLHACSKSPHSPGHTAGFVQSLKAFILKINCWVTL